MTDAPSRRHFMKMSLVAPSAALSTTMLAGCSPSQDGKADYAPTFFDPAEWRFVTAAVARLIPEDAMGPGAIAACVPEYIDRQMATPWAHGDLWYRQGPFDAEAPATAGYQSPLTPRDVYRHGIAGADQAAQAAHGKPFADLPGAAQDDFLARMEKGRLSFGGIEARSFFAFLLANTREGFFCDPRHRGNRNMVGWKLIGFPGARADFMDWVERDVRYPMPPVDIAGLRS